MPDTSKRQKELRKEGFRAIGLEEQLIYRRANKERIAKEVKESITAEAKKRMEKEAVVKAKQELVAEQQRKMALLESLG